MVERSRASILDTITARMDLGVRSSNPAAAYLDLFSLDAEFFSGGINAKATTHIETNFSGGITKTHID